MLCRKGSDSDVLVLVDHTGGDFMDVHFISIGELTLIPVGVGARLYIDAVGFNDVFGHGLDSLWAIDLQWHPSSYGPRAEDKVGIANRVIRVQMSNEGYFQICGFECFDSFVN